MIKFHLIPILFCLLFNGCKDKNSFNGGIKAKKDKYLEFKSQFDSVLTSHYPKMINSTENLMISNTNSEKNDVGLFLIEYNVSINEIKNLEGKIINNFHKKYNTKDSCLLIVNRFETIITKNNFEIPKIKDSLLIDKPCYKDLFPIPNFIDISIADKSNFWSDENFFIYVLEAKKGNHFKEFDLRPNPQMPYNWENGYSKGIAINQKKRIVVYWSIIW